MDEFCSRKTASGLFFSRKRSSHVVRDSSTERGKSTPVCSRVGCSSRMSSIQTSPVEKPKPTKRPLYSPKNGKEATPSSSKAPASPVPRKSSYPSKSLTNAFDRASSRTQTKEASSSVSVLSGRHGKETNVSRESTTSSSLASRNSNSGSSNYRLKNLKCSMLNDVDSSSASTSGSSSSSSELVIGRKKTMGRKRVVGEVESSLATRGKKTSNDSNNGISITESTRTRSLGSSRRDSVTSARASRSSSRAEQETESRIIPRTAVSSLVPLTSLTLDTDASISEYLYPFGNNGNMASNLGHSSTSRGGARRTNLDSIAQMLMAMETIDQDDDLTYEGAYLLRRNLGSGSRDQHRDMRLDIDHMSYEELLELGDRMGTVSTALSEEMLTKCLKKSIYETAVDGMVRTGDDTKCSICQEEYEEGDDVGRLVVCEHGYHSDCIEQWLKLKNWCPICKSSAAAP